MDISRNWLLERLLHYLAMFFGVWIVMSAVWRVYGRLEVWLELAVVAAACLAYIALVRRLGIAPDSWQPD
jgi:hypothetical protein